ncbi:hypothetical protein D3C87_680600 [compost metagenome]
MVMGPTPPGTGVSQPATRSTSGWTSPASLPSGRRLVPTSITTAPGLIMSGVIMWGRPTAATTRSASRTLAARSRVREWQRVTVASALVSSMAMGLPTMTERPTTTASMPERGIS